MEHVAAPEGTPLRYLQKTLAPILEIVGNGCQWRDTGKILRASWDFEDLRGRALLGGRHAASL